MKHPFWKERHGEPKFIKVDYPSSYLHKYQGVALARFANYFGIHANYYTFLSIVFGILAAYLFFTNQLILGGLCFWIRMWFDSADGKTARLNKQVSEFGSKFDYLGDTLSPILMYAGLWYSQFYLQGNSFLGLFLIGLHYLVMFVGFVLIDRYSYKTRWENLVSYYSPFEEAYITFMFAPILGLVFLLMSISITIQIISYSILIIKFGNLNNL